MNQNSYLKEKKLSPRDKGIVESGFTLIELMIVVSIVAILALYAIPTYRQYVLESRRSEARAALEEIRGLEYEFFQNYKVFGTRAQIGYTSTTTHDYYQLNVSATGLRYSASATAIGNQTDDEACILFSYTSTGAYMAYDSSNVLNTSCW
jgi:type IV pilus assembly protein PilE